MYKATFVRATKLEKNLLKRFDWYTFYKTDFVILILLCGLQQDL